MTSRIAIPAAIALAIAAMPATAAPWSISAYRQTETRLEADFRQLSRQYDRAVRAGMLDRREAQRIGQRLSEIDRLGRRYSRDGRFNRGERQRLERLIGEARFELRQSAERGRGHRPWQPARW